MTWLPQIQMPFRNRPRITCPDGFTVSVQAGEDLYCSPRVSGLDRYSAYEVGFPSEACPELQEYAEDKDNPTETVYGYVPESVILAVLARHGYVAKEPQ